MLVFGSPPRQSCAVVKDIWKTSGTRKRSSVIETPSWSILHEQGILKTLNFEIDGPCVVQWSLLCYSALRTYKGKIGVGETGTNAGYVQFGK